MATIIAGGPVACPYCNQTLEKAPGRKKKCPHCNNFILVRTRPKDEKRVLVTEIEAEEIEKEWHVRSGVRNDYLNERGDYEDAKNILKNKFGRDPPENDVKWYLLNNDLLKYSTNNDWGHYRNTRFTMGELLRKEGKYLNALAKYFEVIYLDINGPNNLGGKGRDDMSFPQFDPSMGILAPGVIDIVCKIIDYLELDLTKVKEYFFKWNQKIQESMRLPISIEDGWITLQKEFDTK